MTDTKLHFLNYIKSVFPIYFKKKVVLDIFDSFFLKIDKPGDKLLWLKKIIYNKAYKIIVTDQNRQLLMPHFSNKKVFVVENYPYYNSNNFEIAKKRKLNIFFRNLFLISIVLKKGTKKYGAKGEIKNE